MQISNFQLSVNVDAESYVTGYNLIYDRKNADGTIDRVMRIWFTYGCRHENRSGVRNKAVIEKPLPCQVKTLEKFATQCEKFSHLWTNTVNGKLLSTTRLSPQPAPAPKPAPKAAPPKNITASQMLGTTQALQTQVNALAAKIAELTQRLAKEVATKDAIKLELEVTKGKLAVIEGYLKMQ
jgi:hypothetical protein